MINKNRPLAYLITDRSKLPQTVDKSNLCALESLIERAFSAGIDMAQIRERDLSTKELFHLARRSVEAARRHGGSLLINDRADVAASLGAGVHLTTRSMKADCVRKAFGREMLVGASTHSLKEALEAQREGADFIVFGPVFETGSKKIYGPPVGLDALAQVASLLTIPVLALGGIDLHNFKSALDRRAAGIAAISLFAEAQDLSSLVREIRNYKSKDE